MILGCIESDTIQEVGGDVMFLAPDGLRLLSATDRIGDFGLGVVSKNIQDDLVTFISTNTNFTSCVVREKSQYRIFGYNNNITQENAQGNFSHAVCRTRWRKYAVFRNKRYTGICSG